jgi:hypothetical protein
LLDQIDDPLASLTGDGAYDQDGVYGEVAARHPDAAVIVPPHALVAKIREVAADLPIALTVIDTVSRAMGGGNENAPEDMGSFRASLDRIRDELRCHVLAVHHCGKNRSLGMRGHSLLLGDIDTELEVAAGPPKTVTVNKQRDAESGAPITFSLKPLILGTNQVGQIISSCIVTAAEVAAPAKEKTAPKRIKMPPAARIALDALGKAIDKTGTAPPPSGDHIPSSARVVSIETWRGYYYAMVPLDDDKPEKAKGARKKSFQRAREVLQAEPSTIKVWNDLVWIIPNQE